MKEPPYLSTIIVNLTECPNTLQQDLKQKNGVHEIAWQPAEQLLYVKIDKTKTTEQQLRKAIEQGSLGHAH
jgi:cation transport ATPase